MGRRWDGTGALTSSSGCWPADSNGSRRARSNKAATRARGFAPWNTPLTLVVVPRQAATRMTRVDGALTRNGRCWAATCGLHHRGSSIDTEE
jgi:hypothetical protein